MIVTCQSCLQHYKLDESKVKPLGSKVRCGKCKAVFTVFPPDVEPMAEDVAPLEPSPIPSTTQPPPPAPSTTPPPPPPPTTQPPPPPMSTPPPQVETVESTVQEDVPPDAGQDDVVIVMPGTETLPDVDSVVAEQDTVVFATSDAGKEPISEPEPTAFFEAGEEPMAEPGPAAAFSTGEDTGSDDVRDEIPKTLSKTEDEAGHRPMVEEPPPKKGSLSIIFFLIMLPAVIYGALVYLDKKGYEMPWLQGLNLPYISQSSDSRESLPHEMIIATDINSRFIRNNEDRPLFVIAGKLTNRGETAQQAVQVTGELFGEGDTVLARKIVVGGRFLSDLDLIALSQGDIDQKLSTMNNAAQAPVIDVGASIPFMVVFSDIDEQLKEFSINVTGSDPAS